MQSDSQLPPYDSDEVGLLVEFWNGLRVSEDCGATTWEVLEGLEKGVTECLAAVPQDITTARHLTAEAMLLISRPNDF